MIASTSFPSKHASTHFTGGSDPIAPSDIGAATQREIKTTDFTAAVNGQYTTNGTITVTDPSGTVAGQTYSVWCGSGTVVIGAVTYSPSRIQIIRYYNGASWSTLSPTLSDNLTLNGTANTAPNQTAASGSSLMTRGLVDARMPSSAFYYIRDDFTTGGTTSGTIGYLRWNLTNGSSGSISCAGAAHASPQIGVVRLTTSAAASGEGGALHLAYPSSATPSLFSAFSWTLEAILAPVATTNISIRAGVLATPQNGGNDASSASRGVYVRYDTAAGDTNWMGVIGSINSGEVRRTVSLGVAPSAGTFVRFNIRRISATQYGFSVNGGAETTLSITAGDTGYDVAAQPCVAVTTRTTGAASCAVDFYSVYAPLSR